MLDGTHYVECACDSTEHALRFVVDKKADEIYTEVFLNPWLPWYKRLWRAFRYILGYSCKYGHWDCTILNRESRDALRRVMDELDG